MTNLTVKNIPEDLYNHLKTAAQAHHRSINSEMIYCLESVLKPKKISTRERLQRFASVRPQIDDEAINLEEMQDAIDEGRS